MWECIRNRTQENVTCSKAVIRNDLRAKGLDVDKKFWRWLGKLVDAGIVFVEGDVVHVIVDI